MSMNGSENNENDIEMHVEKRDKLANLFQAELHRRSHSA